MAKHLDAIRIWGEGIPPSNCPGIDFVPVFHPEVLRYWVVLFSSHSMNAILVGKQLNKTDDISKKIFVGFYSLNPFVVDSLRRSFALLGSGLGGALQMWESKCKFPKITTKELRKILPDADLSTDKKRITHPRRRRIISNP
jgi:hypothetical protein